MSPGRLEDARIRVFRQSSREMRKQSVRLLASIAHVQPDIRNLRMSNVAVFLSVRVSHLIAVYWNPIVCVLLLLTVLVLRVYSGLASQQECKSNYKSPVPRVTVPVVKRRTEKEEQSESIVRVKNACLFCISKPRSGALIQISCRSRHDDL